MSAPVPKPADRLRDRFQVQVQINWQLMPTRDDTWLQWAFSPYCGVTRVGQKFAPFTNGRRFLPEGPSIHTMVDTVDDGKGIDPATGLKNWWFESRVFWLRGAIRVLGLDLGFGIYLRKPFALKAQPPAAQSSADLTSSAARNTPTSGVGAVAGNGGEGL